MTLKILDPDDGTQMYMSFADFFDINNPGDYELYEDHNYTGAVDFLVQNAIANYPNYTKYHFKQLLFLDIRHNYEDQVALLHSNQTPRIVITNARDDSIQDHRILFNDYLFNITKAYYNNYPFTARQVWHQEQPGSYTVPGEIDPKDKTKIYIAANRAYIDADYPEQRMCRRRLMNHLKIHHRELGYLGNSADPEVGGLRSNMPNNNRFSGYNPPHIKYYENSFISLVVESLEYGTTYAATEKTFEPLIKGHFVLPLGIHRFVELTQRHYGFEFPDFIDYSYDQIEDRDRRYQAYNAEVERLLALPLATWCEHWVNYKVLRNKNQQIFHNRDYHRTDLTSILE